MKKTLNIGSVKLPEESATKGFGFIGKRGSGKSYAAAVFAEELFKANIPFVVFDPIDVWWGLKVAADGKGKGLPVVVFGREHADIQLDRTMGRRIAEAVVKENISCVISTFGMNKTEMREVVADFSERLLQINNTPRQVIIEEAHEFVPQRVQGAMAKCFSAVEALLVMGRNRGIGVSLLNQRMATLNKDLLTQIDVLVAFRSVGPQDRAAFKDWVAVHDAMDDGVLIGGLKEITNFDKFMVSIPKLPTGEAWIWSPEFLEIFKLVQFRKRETFHPDREKLGVSFKMPEIRQGDVQSFIDSFSKKPELPHIPKKDLDKVHVARISGIRHASYVEVEREIKVAKKKMDEEYARGYSAGNKAGWDTGHKAAAEEHRKVINKCAQILMRTHGDIDKAMELLNIEHSAGVRTSPPVIRPPAESPAAPLDLAGFYDAKWSGEKKLTGLGVRMLEVLASMYPMKFTRSQLALQVGMTASGGGFRNYLGAIKANGYATEEAGIVQATDEGVIAAGVDPRHMPPGPEMRAMWREKLTGKGKEMFDVICENYPSVMTREFIAALVGMEVAGGGFRNYLGTMVRNGLIKNVPGGIQASHDLFKI